MKGSGAARYTQCLVQVLSQMRSVAFSPAPSAVGQSLVIARPLSSLSSRDFDEAAWSID